MSEDTRETIIQRFEAALVQMRECSRYTPEDVDELESAAWDVLPLLKDSTAHLITVEEFTNHPDRSAQGCIPLWYEEIDGKQGWCFVYVLKSNPDLIFGKRYWTARPTDEQREATPWN